MSRRAVRIQSQIDQSRQPAMLQVQELHCAACGRFFGYQAVIYGIVKLKCSKCKEWTTIDIRPDA